jgi:hypothetical protein
MIRKPYPSDVSDEEWSLAAPYLTLMREDASQRENGTARHGISQRSNRIEGGRKRNNALARNPLSHRLLTAAEMMQELERLHSLCWRQHSEIRQSLSSGLESLH